MTKAVTKLHQPEDLLGLARYDEMSAGDLKKELARELGLTAEKLIRCAAIWRALERIGEDLSGIKDGFTLYLPHIAAGSVLPELVVAFAGKPALLKKLSRLTPVDQRRMVDGEPVQVVVKPGELRMLPVRTLTSNQINQVIGDGTIRTEREQIALVCDVKPKVAPGKPAKVGKVRIDKASGLVHIGRNFAPYTDVIAALTAAGLT